MGISKLIIGLLTICAGGCSTARYESYSPSYRTTSDRAEAKNAYVGLNFKYAVDRPSEYHGASGTAAEPVVATPTTTADIDD